MLRAQKLISFVEKNTVLIFQQREFCLIVLRRLAFENGSCEENLLICKEQAVNKNDVKTPLAFYDRIMVVDLHSSNFLFIYNIYIY